MEQVTRVLEAMAAGDAHAADELLPLVYRELRRFAESRLAQTPPGNTLQPTALVHEAYLQLVHSGDPGWSGRNHFFGAAARAMREILVDQARRKSRERHGGALSRVDLDPEAVSFETESDAILAVDDALTVLETEDPRSARIVTLRYFGGLSEDETAAVLAVSKSTVAREWRFARTWLHRRLGGSLGPPAHE